MLTIEDKTSPETITIGGIAGGELFKYSGHIYRKLVSSDWVSPAYKNAIIVMVMHSGALTYFTDSQAQVQRVKGKLVVE